MMTNSTAPTSEVTMTPTDTPAPVQPTVSMIPVVTPAPTPVITPTPAPTPTPQPAGIALGSGQFKSDTGLWINTVASWSAETVSATEAEVTITVDLKSYSLYMGGRNDALIIELGEHRTALDVEALELETKEEVTTKLGSITFTVDAPQGKTTTLPLKTEWLFGGTYSGEEVPSIIAEGDITLKR